MADTPTNTYGSISRSTWTFWKNISFDATTDGGAPVAASNIQSYMNRVALQLVRGTDAADLAVADNTYYRAYLESPSDPACDFREDGRCRLHLSEVLRCRQEMDVVLDGGIGGSIPRITCTS